MLSGDSTVAIPSVVVLGFLRLTLKELLEEAGTAENLTTDAHLAALTIEHGAELHSTDSDFARFARLRWVNLLAAWRDGTDAET